MDSTAQESRRESLLSVRMPSFDAPIDSLRLALFDPDHRPLPSRVLSVHDSHDSPAHDPPNLLGSLTSSLTRLERSFSRTMQRYTISPVGSARSRHDSLRPIGSGSPDSSNLSYGRSNRHSSYLRSMPDASDGRPLRPPLSVPRPFSTLFLPHNSRPIPHDSSNTRSCSTSAMLPTNSRLTATDSLSPSGDELPSYTRRAPLIRPGSMVTNLSGNFRASRIFTTGSSESHRDLPLKPHIITSASGKVQLTLFSPGRSRYPMLQQGIDKELKGELKLNLGEFGESFSEIRVKCKGVVRTLVYKLHGSSSHPMQDEVVFMHQDQSLHQPSILSASESKLSGIIKFPFRFMIPSTFADDTPLPPSFSLTSSSSVPDVGRKIVEWGSVKYYIKVTLARRGLLRSNERLFAPFVMLSKHIMPPITSMNRLAAFDLGLPIPNPSEDPEGWMGRKIRQHIKITGPNLSRSQRSAWYEVMVLLPSPLCYARNQPLPYYLKFTSSNTDITTEFEETSFKVSLFQRCVLSAVGMSGTHENTISYGCSKPEGFNNGITLPTFADDFWSRRFQGELSLGHHTVPNFSCPNISVQYYFTLTVSLPGQINDLQISLPIQLVSSPNQITPELARLVEFSDGQPLNLSRGVSPSSSYDSIAPRSRRARHSSPLVPHPVGSGQELPPSYFDVQEMDMRRATMI